MSLPGNTLRCIQKPLNRTELEVAVLAVEQPKRRSIDVVGFVWVYLQFDIARPALCDYCACTHAAVGHTLGWPKTREGIAQG